MLEDLKELRRILDRFIAKYEEQDAYRFEHDPRLVEDLKKRDTYEIEGDDRLKEVGKTILKNSVDDLTDDRLLLTDEGFWRGNDIY
tara:strand:+ start:387 stop:644 length:258 start_codon:yes stop_codon:yes gene_type:complete